MEDFFEEDWEEELEEELEENEFKFVGKYLQKELSSEFILSATLVDKRNLLICTTRNPISLSKFIDAESMYIVSINYHNNDFSSHRYDIEVRGEFSNLPTFTEVRDRVL